MIAVLFTVSSFATLILSASGETKYNGQLITDDDLFTPIFAVGGHDGLRRSAEVQDTLECLRATGLRSNLVDSDTLNSIKESVAATCGQDSLKVNGALEVGSYLKNHTCFFYVKSQDIVLYDNETVLWSQSAGSSKALQLILQEDGLLVLYGHDGKVAWKTGIKGKTPKSLDLEKDCALNLYNKANKIIWTAPITRG